MVGSALTVLKLVMMTMTAESPWVKAGEGQQGAGLWGLCYGPASWDEWVLGTFCKWLPEAPWSPALVLMATSAYQMSAGNTTQQRGSI